MLGPIIGITTSIATMTAVACAQAGAAAITGGRRRRQVAPARRVIVRKNADRALATLAQALEAERHLRGQLERENARMREKLEAAEEVFAFMQRGA